MSFSAHADFSPIVTLSGQLADVARAIALRYFRTTLAVEQKPDHSPVTIADRAIETELRRLIRAAFPSHGIRGEEFAAEAGADFTWVLDPIDGTKSFISGFPLFGSLIALLQDERPVLGVIEAPAQGERWIGCEGLPTVFNGAPARTSGCQSLERACVYTTSPDAFGDADRARFDRLSRRAALRRFGGDCYMYGLLASGHCDLVVETSLKPHDFQALMPVIAGAGGQISDWHGRALTSQSDGRVVAAATPTLWAAAVAGLNQP